MVPGQWYHVQWIDAHNLEAGWEHVDEQGSVEPAVVDTIGHFLSLSNAQVVLAADWCKDEKIVNTRVAIPIGCVTGVWRLKHG